jgi:lipopolysaccharide/colanic/teichoic acid biosynthesis glycosyltransferase
MTVDADLHGSPHDRASGSLGLRLAAPPSVTELSAEAAELIRTVVLEPAKATRVALVGICSWDFRTAFQATAPRALPHLPTKPGSEAPDPGAVDPNQMADLLSAWERATEGRAPAEVLSADDHPSLAAADAIVICGPVHADDGLGLGRPALAETCATVADAAIAGQTIILASASYVGSTRDLLIAPLERRGFVIGRDVHVAFSAVPTAATLGQSGRPHLLGGATPECADVAAAFVSQMGAVEVVYTLEEAEASALAGPPRSRLGAAVKRAIDIAIASAGLLLMLPILALIAMAIILDDGRPILFTQERIGLNGHRFRVRKFRTMVDGAEARLHEVLEMNQIRGPGFQIDRDPRVSRIGGFLRTSSLDELPQLWNVLRGEMSLVGPRPAPLFEVAAYEPWHRRRLTVKPGITGLAQIRARSYREFNEKATLDLQYIDQWSLWLDLKILLQTGPTVLRFTGR